MSQSLIIEFLLGSDTWGLGFRALTTVGAQGAFPTIRKLEHRNSKSCSVKVVKFLLDLVLLDSKA